MSQDLSDIVGVVTCGWRRANEYLEHGYVLLELSEWSDEREMKPMVAPDGSERSRSYVKKGVSLTLGRTAATPAFNPVEREPPTE